MPQDLLFYAVIASFAVACVCILATGWICAKTVTSDDYKSYRKAFNLMRIGGTFACIFGVLACIVTPIVAPKTQPAPEPVAVAPQPQMNNEACERVLEILSKPCCDMPQIEQPLDEAQTSQL